MHEDEQDTEHDLIHFCSGLTAVTKSSAKLSAVKDSVKLLAIVIASEFLINIS
jgi:hypothetical protein